MGRVKAKRVVIVGGGVVGLCAGYSLLRRGGCEVVVFERGEKGHDSCALGSAGLVVPSHVVPLAAPGVVKQGLKWMADAESPFYIKPRVDAGLAGWLWRFWRASTRARAERAMPLLCEMSLRSRKLFEGMASGEEAMSFGLKESGLLMLFRTEETGRKEAEAARYAQALGLRVDVLNGEEVAAMDEEAGWDVAGGVYFADDCLLRPEVFLAGLEEEILGMGGEIRWGSEVKDFAVSEGKVDAVELESGEGVEGDEFVLAGGVWSERLGKRLGVRMPLQAGKGYSLTVENPPVVPKHPALLLEARVAVTPMGGAVRFGGTMEISGIDERVDGRRVKGMVKAVPDYLPAFEAECFAGVEPWSGLRPCSPDGLPYLGRLEHLGNVVAACGHGFLGVSLGPVTGEVVAGLVYGEEVDLELGLMAPQRYG